MNIVLIGYRGAGKSAVGRRLAEILEMGFLDTDDLLEESQGIAIREIVESLGWEHFRAMEKLIIQKVSKMNDFIIAPGGGAVLDPENVRFLKKNGLILWLKADAEILGRRIKRDFRTSKGRPTLTGKGALEEIQEVLSSRNPLYAKAADIEIDTSTLDMEAVVERAASIIRGRMEA